MQVDTFLLMCNYLVSQVSIGVRSISTQLGRVLRQLHLDGAGNRKTQQQTQQLVLEVLQKPCSMRSLKGMSGIKPPSKGFPALKAGILCRSEWGDTVPNHRHPGRRRG